MADADREWSSKQRTGWWIKTIGMAAALAASALAGGRWIYTRASIEDLAALDARKADRTQNALEHQAIGQRIDSGNAVVQNVRDNLIIMMERQRIEPKPLPPQQPAPVVAPLVSPP